MAPNSMKERKKRELRERRLEKKVKKLSVLQDKLKANSKVVEVKSTSLGDLRRRSSCKQTDVPEGLIQKVGGFKRMSLKPNEPLFIHGSDGGLLAAGMSNDDTESVRKLDESIEALKKGKSKCQSKGKDRGKYEKWIFTLWSPYRTEPIYSKDYRVRSKESETFIEVNRPVFQKLTNLLGQVAPGVFKELQRFPVKNGLSRLCGAWCGCIVNRMGLNAGPTTIHRDVKEPKYGYSGLICTGDFTGGGLILYDLEIILELRPGDMLIFVDSVIHHSNEPVQGRRNSVVCFTQRNMYDYWQRTYGMRIGKADWKLKRKRCSKV